MKINFKKLSDLATTPTYAHDGDAALDLYAATNRTIAPGSRALIATDIAVEIPRGYFGMITGRSGSTIKYGVVGQVGIIDSGYRGGIGVMLFNTDSENPFVVTKGDRIGQLIVMYAPTIDMRETDTLADSERSAHGFGSTGR